MLAVEEQGEPCLCGWMVHVGQATSLCVHNQGGKNNSDSWGHIIYMVRINTRLVGQLSTTDMYIFADPEKAMTAAMNVKMQVLMMDSFWFILTF